MDEETPRKVGEFTQARNDIDELFMRVRALEARVNPDLLDEARNARPDLFSNTDSPQTVSDPMGEGGEGASEPYVPDFTLIPDALARFAQADETAAEFRSRLKRLWQRFGIADGENFPGGGEPLTGEEKITMREIDIVLNSDEGKNASLLSWLLADEQRT